MNALISDGNQLWMPSGPAGRFAPVFAMESIRPGDGEGRFAIEEWSPRFDRAENDHELVLEACVPEMKRLEVRISVDDRALTISGERRFEEKEEMSETGEIQREYGHFWRSFVLPDGTLSGGVSAEFKDGVLRVYVPKDAPRSAGTGAGSAAD